MAKISELFPEYVSVADRVRTGEIPSIPENEEPAKRPVTGLMELLAKSANGCLVADASDLVLDPHNDAAVLRAAMSGYE